MGSIASDEKFPGHNSVEDALGNGNEVNSSALLLISLVLHKRPLELLPLVQGPLHKHLSDLLVLIPRKVTQELLGMSHPTIANKCFTLLVITWWSCSWPVFNLFLTSTVATFNFHLSSLPNCGASSPCLQHFNIPMYQHPCISSSLCRTVRINCIQSLFSCIRLPILSAALQIQAAFVDLTHHVCLTLVLAFTVVERWLQLRKAKLGDVDRVSGSYWAGKVIISFLQL